MTAVARAMEPFEVIEVETSPVACDGGEGPLGHPRVYLEIGPSGSIECPYCSRRYVLKAGAPKAGVEAGGGH
ncbi:MAG: zinc-finger domain-containing protein [Pseudomonadota bacterium]